jgi:hypothetical protein
MKKSFTSVALIGASLIFGLGSPASSFADHGTAGGGGGDIQCDKLIQDLSFGDPAGNLRHWLNNGGPEAGKKLDLSSSLSPTGQPYTLPGYEKAMTALIDIFAKSPDVNCVRPGDKGYPVDVNDTSKICKTFVDETGVHMTCDRDLFMGLTPDEQIEQNHHEFAINVQGLESDTGSISTYKISRQLAKSIGNAIERRLIINTQGPLPKIVSTSLTPIWTMAKPTYFNLPLGINASSGDPSDYFGKKAVQSWWTGTFSNQGAINTLNPSDYSFRVNTELNWQYGCANDDYGIARNNGYECMYPAQVTISLTNCNAPTKIGERRQLKTDHFQRPEWVRRDRYVKLARSRPT